MVMQLLKKKNSVYVGSKIPLNQRVIIEKTIGRIYNSIEREAKYKSVQISHSKTL